MKSRISKKLLLFVLTLFALAPLSVDAAATEAKTLFAQAGEAYQAGKYSEAISLYKQILEQNLENGELYFNLGNSYFKNRQLGYAVLNYKRAAALIPRDADLKVNFQYSLSLRQEHYPPVHESFLTRFFRARSAGLTFNEIVWLIFSLTGFLAVVHLLSLFRGWRGLRRNALLGVLCAGILFYVSVLVAKYSFEKNLAVVLTATEVRFEPRSEATVHFPLAEGEEVKSLEASGNWVKVERADHKLGWVVNTSLEQVFN